MELVSIVAADGLIYDFTQFSGRYVLATPLGIAMPTLTFFTRRPYKLAGEIEIDDPRPEARDISFLFRLQSTCSREDYWTARSELINATRPNRGGLVTWLFELADGTRRALMGRPTSPQFSSSTDVSVWDEWGFTEEIQIRCFDPIIFDPDITTITLAEQSVAAELVFPITFDDDGIVFGDDGFWDSTVINYTGTWYSFPIITITGPCDRWLIRHIEKNIVLQSPVPIASGDVLTIDLVNKTFTDNNGDSIALDITSDILNFRIEPEPIVTDGINTISFALPGSVDGVSSVTMIYNTRYIGM